MALPGMTAALQARGLADRRSRGAAERRRASRRGSPSSPRSSLGLTGADAGLAETGSVVLATGPGRPRMASLLVPVHVAVLRVDRLVESISALLATRGDLVAAGSNLVAITGPEPHRRHRAHAEPRRARPRRSPRHPARGLIAHAPSPPDVRPRLCCRLGLGRVRAAGAIAGRRSTPPRSIAG